MSVLFLTCLALSVIVIGLALTVWDVAISPIRRRAALLERQTDLRSIRAMSWQAFEALVGEAYRRQGYSVLETGGGGADGGVDLRLRRNGDTTIVQCKQWRKGKVGAPVIRELYGIVTAEKAVTGVAISCGTFTRQARTFAKDKPLRLVDGLTLLKMIAKVQSAPELQAALARAKPCPQCTAPMALRAKQHGRGAGSMFWGCTAYPYCKATRPYQAGRESDDLASSNQRTNRTVS
jgi:restriction system protein